MLSGGSFVYLWITRHYVITRLDLVSNPSPSIESNMLGGGGGDITADMIHTTVMCVHQDVHVRINNNHKIKQRLMHRATMLIATELPKCIVSP